MEDKQKVYIKGVPDRGDEVIKVLTDLGAKSSFRKTGTFSSLIYYIKHDGTIGSTNINGEVANIIEDNYKEIKLSKKWKDGDILIRNDGTDYKVFWEYDSDSYTSFYAHNVSMHVNGTITQYSGSIWHGEKILCFRKDYQLATLSEVERFHELLHKHCKEWDVEKNQLIDWRWKPKVKDIYYYVDNDGDIALDTWDECFIDTDRYNFGNCFQTKEEAEAAAERVRKVLKGE